MKSIHLAVIALAALVAPVAADPAPAAHRPLPMRIAALDEPMAPATAAMAPLPEPGPARETTLFGLPKNVGTGDRILRTVIGLGLAGAGAYGLASGELSDTTSGVLLGVSAVPFATAATGYCPLYQVLGIDRSF